MHYACVFLIWCCIIQLERRGPLYARPSCSIQLWNVKVLICKLLCRGPCIQVPCPKRYECLHCFMHRYKITFWWRSQLICPSLRPSFPQSRCLKKVKSQITSLGGTERHHKHTHTYNRAKMKSSSPSQNISKKHNMTKRTRHCDDIADAAATAWRCCSIATVLATTVLATTVPSAPAFVVAFALVVSLLLVPPILPLLAVATGLGTCATCSMLSAATIPENSFGL